MSVIFQLALAGLLGWVFTADSSSLAFRGHFAIEDIEISSKVLQGVNLQVGRDSVRFHFHFRRCKPLCSRLTTIGNTE